MWNDIFSTSCEFTQDAAFANITTTTLPNLTVTEALQHFARCYQNNILVTIPPLFLVIFCPLLMYALQKSQNPKLECSFPICARTSIGIILIAVSAFQFFYNLYRKGYLGEDIPTLWISSAALRYAGLCVAVLLTYACRNRGVVTSGVLFNFWLLLVICGIPEFISKYTYSIQTVPQYFKLINDKLAAQHYDDQNKSAKDGVQSICFIVYFVLVCLQVVLSCFADTPKYNVKDDKACPEHYSSFLSQITFNWFSGMAYTGYKRSLTMEDLWRLNSCDESRTVVEEFNKNFNAEMKSFNDKKRKQKLKKERNTRGNIIKLESQNSETRKLDDHHSQIPTPDDAPSILWPIFKTFRLTFIGGGLYKLMFDLLQFVSPQLLSKLIYFIEDKNQPLWIGVVIAFCMFLVALLQSMIINQYFRNMFQLGMNIRSVLISTVYRKALFLSSMARRNRSVGEIVTIMSVDIQRIQDITTFIMLFWSSPLQIALSIFFLGRLLGWSILGGLAILVALIPFNLIIASKMKDYQVQHMKLKDQRLKMVNEVLSGIKVLKLYNWEDSLESTIHAIRQKELLVLEKLAYLNAATSLSWSCAPFLVAVVTFGFYVIIDPVNNVLTPQVTFVGLSLFNILRFPLAVFAMIFSQFVQTKVSNKRLKTFLADEEIDLTDIDTRLNSNGKALSLKDCTFTWDRDHPPLLKNINIQVEKGALVAIVGRTGAGKSSLLSALLGEMSKESGSAHMNGSIAYVPQQSWIQNMSFRDNIIFNKPFDQKLYEEVVDACCLRADFETLPNGDLTEIGEKGINLSGGTRSRCSTARALFANKDIYIIDDALSAVDAHVGKHIFDNVLSSSTGMLKEKTRVLVTHSLHLLKYCDYIYVMKSGHISEAGNYQELLKNNGELAVLLAEFLMEEAKSRGRSVSFGDDADEVREVLEHLENLDPEKKRRIEKELSRSIESNLDQDQENKDRKVSETSLLLDKEKKIEEAKLLPNGIKKGAIIQQENMETGEVELSVYITYFKAIGYYKSVIFILIYVGSSMLGILSNLRLASWSDEAVEIQARNDTYQTKYNLAVYTLLGIGQATTVCVASIIMTLGMVIASEILHEGMLKRILRSPMSFFDTTPMGRVLNRFGKDIDALDSRLPGAIMTVTSTLVQGIATFVVPVYATPMILCAVIPIMFIYLLIRRFYVNTSRQLKRLESTSRSPIYSHFQESVQGATSIRAYGCVDTFLQESHKRVDYNLVTYYPSIVANRWLAVRLELVGNIIVLSSALFAVLSRQNSSLTAGLVGLSVSYALNVTQTLNWAVRMTSELETNIVAVERIKEYSDNEMEASTETDPKITNLPPNWPTHGLIKIKDLTLRYRDELPLTLHGISLETKPKEKIGIVGRTGAGKSSLSVVLFRLVEPASGVIEIDGIDITKIGLNDLRSRITIVPQDPALFSGTLRFNLDPFEVHTDDDIWKSLQLTYLDAYVTSLPNKLEYQIQESGSNLSVGQRQLLCLARALLRKSAILVLDEASASVDVETDQLIQKTIKEQFENCTVLTIAHRINTVSKMDRILVMDKGLISEFDTPDKLLENPNGMYRSLAIEAGVVSPNN
uniref:Multidrug resistance-associated protein lethal(2)03659 n=1 Tax=Rhabditophanes sp. KR3021 TaxID=114890 RepID=A0AC35TYJ0_9BILA